MATKSKKKYYSLAVQYEIDGWVLEFGSYDKEKVKQEKKDSYGEYTTKILTTEANQLAITEAINLLRSTSK